MSGALPPLATSLRKGRGGPAARWDYDYTYETWTAWHSVPDKCKLFMYSVHHSFKLLMYSVLSNSRTPHWLLTNCTWTKATSQLHYKIGTRISWVARTIFLFGVLVLSEVGQPLAKKSVTPACTILSISTLCRSLLMRKDWHSYLISRADGNAWIIIFENRDIWRVIFWESFLCCE